MQCCMLCGGNNFKNPKCPDNKSILVFVGIRNKIETFIAKYSMELDQWNDEGYGKYMEDSPTCFAHPDAIVDTGRVSS